MCLGDKRAYARLVLAFAGEMLANRGHASLSNLLSREIALSCSYLTRSLRTLGIRDGAYCVGHLASLFFFQKVNRDKTMKYS